MGAGRETQMTSRLSAAERAVVDTAMRMCALPLYAHEYKQTQVQLEKACRALRDARLHAPSLAHARANSPETSQEAAEWMTRNFRAGHAAARVYAVISTIPGGLTTDQVQQRMRETHQTVSPRITELRDRGLIKDSGRRRKTRSGRAAIVWESSPLGREAARHVPEWNF